ncbi:DUF4430 domain-containing protein [Facklamia hominis]|uniref:DUF4430 domain-containing protein n=1 Tax=Facklamia hominis TaxID=178214 RepID=UPI0038FBF3C1
MNKRIKIIFLALTAFLLVACKNTNQKPTVENAPAESGQTTEAASQTSAEESTSGEEAKQAQDESGADAQGEAGTATIIIYKNGEVEHEYTVNQIGGVSVLDAMKTIKELDFNFSEQDGVIDQIGDAKNDYNPNTWMYLYNGAFAELGVVSQKLKDGDKIEWYYGTINDIPVNIIPAQE